MNTAAAPAAVQQPEAPQEAEVDEASIVADIFPELADNDAPPPQKAKQPATQADDDDEQVDEPEAEEQAEEQSDPFSLLRLDSLFDEKTLSTRQGIAKARETILTARKAARELHQTANDAHIVAKRHEQTARTKNQEANRAMKAAQALEARVQADIDTAFNSGDAEAVASALSRLTKRDAHKLYEQWTEVQIGKKKAEGQKDPRLDAVLEKLSKLETDKEAEKSERAKQATEQARVQWLQSLDNDIKADAESYRTIAYLLTLDGKARELAEHADELAHGHLKATGKWPSNSQVLQHIENELRPLVRVPKQHPAPAQTNGNGQPKQATRLPGRGVSPTLGSQRSHAKTLDEMSQEEREEKMIEDADEILSGLGLL